RSGQRQDQPVLRDLLHPGADARREGARPEQPVVAVGERAEGPDNSGRPGLARPGRDAGRADFRPAHSGFEGVFSISPVIGTNRTGRMSFSEIFPDLSLESTFSSWKNFPTGMTMRPPGASWSSSGCGMRSGAAVTMIASKGACSGQPRYPSPSRT